MSIKETLLDLSIEEKEERIKAEVDYYFYKGKCEDKEKAKLYKPYLGQNWEDGIERDYEPTQDIRNKVKPLLKKQARWMFSVKPDILINPINSKDKDECEKLRQWIDKVLDENKFWNKTRQAFLMATIKKRTMLRLAAGNGKINIRYEDLDNFSYKKIDDTLIEAKFFQEDLNNAVKDEKVYYLHTFYYKKIDEEVSKATYRKETYKDSELVEVKEQELGFEENKIPCWLIINGGDLGEEFGETDLHDLKVIQQEYNKRVSDVADAIKFGLFGVESVIDGNEDDVNQFKIVPGALHAMHTDPQAAANNKQATIQRLEYSLSGISAVETYLERAEKDMNYILDMPTLKDLNNITSAKAMRYLYNDLIARCEEKWNDWEPVLREVIRYIIAIARESKLPGFDKKWEQLEYSMTLKHNYPIPSDEEEKKTLAINEVINKVRSVKSYIKDFSDDEDVNGMYMEIIKEQSELAGADMAEFSTIDTTDEEDEVDEEKEDEVDE